MSAITASKADKREAIIEQALQEAKAITSLDVKSDALLELLSGALTHVLPSKEMYPALNSVAIESIDGNLVARATDRYRLIVGTVIRAQGELAPSLVGESDVKKILSLLKEYKIPVNVTLSRAGDLLSVSVLGNSITIRVIEASFPTADATDKLLDYESNRELIGEVKFNPKFFSDYAKIVGKSQSVGIEFRADNKPMDIHLQGNGVLWKALLMPMRG